MRSDTVFKRAFNDALDFLSTAQVTEILPSETVLAQRLGVSRTTVRKVLLALEKQGAIVVSGRERRPAGSKQKTSRFPEAETVPMAAQVEKQFMEWMLRDDGRPGTTINELDLARRFGVATTVIREFLNRFEHYGLIEKRPNAGWLFKGFTINFALELFEIREMFELRSAKAFGALAKDSPLWRQLDSLNQEHHALMSDIEDRFHDFSDLDNRFHRLINSAASNRFIDEFYDIISLIFHYHYQWNKKDELQRNQVAIREHIDYIDALKSRDPAKIEQACRAHLASARKTLIRATLN